MFTPLTITTFLPMMPQLALLASLTLGAKVVHGHPTAIRVLPEQLPLITALIQTMPIARAIADPTEPVIIHILFPFLSLIRSFSAHVLRKPGELVFDFIGILLHSLTVNMSKYQEVEFIVRAISRVASRHRDTSDPVLRHNLILEKFNILLDFAASGAELHHADVEPLLQRQVINTISGMRDELKNLSSWIQESHTENQVRQRQIKDLEAKQEDTSSDESDDEPMPKLINPLAPDKELVSDKRPVPKKLAECHVCDQNPKLCRKARRKGARVPLFKD